jgi:hypothetical protein
MLKWFMGILGAVVAGVLVYWLTVGFDFSSNEKYGIYNPSDGSGVTYKTLVEGFCDETVAKRDLWLVVQPIESPYYHPQTGPIPKDRNGRWQGFVYLGTSDIENVGERYLIFIVSADNSASRRFSDYLTAGAETGNGPGWKHCQVA